MTTDAPPHAAPVRKSTVQARTVPRGCMVTGCQFDPIAMVICPAHWKLLPARLRDGCWRAYVAGYDTNTHPSDEYKAALRECVDWLETNTEIPTG